jgi:16S rRNA C1402 N4-methylase RsmH
LENLYYQDQEIFFEVFSRASVSIYKEDNHYITTFINVASSIEYDWLKHRADLMIMSFNSLDDAMVNEATIRAVESWERKDHIPILEKMRKFDSEWVEEYKLAVLEYLRGL